jgi:hypothetical protein
MSEVWKAIPKFEGYYEASNLGRVRSIPRIIVRKNRWGKITEFTHKGRILSSDNKVSNGYRGLILSKGDAIQYSFKVHQLIVRTFNPLENETGYVINHKDGNKENNAVDNLEWITQSQNMSHAVSHGNFKGGYVGLKSKLTPDIVLDIFQDCLSGGKTKDLASKYGVSLSTIHEIRTKNTWGYLLKDLPDYTKGI